MKISGLQKMTLLDYPGKVACTVFLGGCNFRCPFCHNWELLDAGAGQVMDMAEFLQFLSRRKGLLDAVCVSGGEPTLQRDLPELLREIKAMGYLTIAGRVNRSYFLEKTCYSPGRSPQLSQISGGQIA